jgi:hypothetical protein
MKALSSSRSRIRRSVLIAALPIGLIACGSSTQTKPAVGGGPPSTIPGMEAAAPLLGQLTNSVPGLSTQQAATGVGSLLGLAQSKLPPEQYAQIGNAIPGSNALVNGAVQAGLPTSGLNSLSSLNGVFDKAGISPTQVSQMIPVVSDSITKSAGPTAAQHFLSAVK